MLSNGPGTRPKTLSEHQMQFDEYIEKLGIPSNIEDSAKLAILREMPYQRLIDAQKGMQISEFRPLADGQFYPQDSGDFAQRMKQRNISLLSGECRDEHTIYRNWRTPKNSFDSLRARLCAEYPEDNVIKILHHYCGPHQELPEHCNDWQDTFGRIYADLHVHHLQRGFYNTLYKGNLEPGKDVLRYRFDRRVKCIDATIPLDWGVTHSSDIPLWLWGFDCPGGLTDQEKVWLKSWNEQFAAFVDGRKVDWGPTKPEDVRRWKSDGETDIWEDDRWKAGLELWDLLHSL